MAAAVAGGVTSLACPPDTDPPLDEPGLVEMLKCRARSLRTQREVYPVGALTQGLRGERLTEMAELTDAGCVAFSQADRPFADYTVLCARCSTRPPSASRSGCAPRTRQPRARRRRARRRSRDAPRACRHSGCRRNRRARRPSCCSRARPGARVHLCRLSSAEGRRDGAPGEGRGPAVTCDVSAHHVHLSEMDIGYFDCNCHLSPPLRSLRDRDALRARARRRHHRCHLLRPHAGRRRRASSCRSAKPSRVRPASNCCCRSR